ncbi:expressed unknown protein [Seminavis robusta]|uniref:Uncharacterized protein n=1 Tax=Seminavis robusta TaxID=568900 RepID=A0A9N8DTB9_9STRA|nr:expressed unknown protein [Seminavis robusta]|eukprot:Sro341_g121560.1 n/a (324) ;mRNA; f:58497-59468
MLRVDRFASSSSVSSSAVPSSASQTSPGFVECPPTLPPNSIISLDDDSSTCSSNDGNCLGEVPTLPTATTARAILQQQDGDDSSIVDPTTTGHSLPFFSISRLMTMTGLSPPPTPSTSSSPVSEEPGALKMVDPSENGDVRSSLDNGYQGDIEEVTLDDGDNAVLAVPAAPATPPATPTTLPPLTLEEKLFRFFHTYPLPLDLNSTSSLPNPHHTVVTMNGSLAKEQHNNLLHASAATMDTDIECASMSTITTTTTLRQEDHHPVRLVPRRASVCSSVVLDQAAILGPSIAKSRREENCTSYLFSVFVGLAVLGILIIYWIAL